MDTDCSEDDGTYSTDEDCQLTSVAILSYRIVNAAPYGRREVDSIGEQKTESSPTISFWRGLKAQSLSIFRYRSKNQKNREKN